MRPSTMSKAEFVERFGPVYEASAWVAEAVWPLAESGLLDQPEVLAREMRIVVDGASLEMRLALLRAHPELTSRARMADASVREQGDAGLDRVSADELDRFQRLNGAYSARFGFPFILAVKDLGPDDILIAFETRLLNEPESEFEAAIAEVHRIAGFRLAELM